MRRLALPITAFALLAAACGSQTDDPVSAPPTSPVSATPDPTSPEPSEPAEPSPSPAAPQPSPRPTQAFPADTRPDTGTGSGPLVTMTDVRLGRHDGYDRVVLDVEGAGRPGWRVEYVERAIADGSGEPVRVAGGAILQVLLDHSGMPDDTGVEFYDGPRRVPGPGLVTEVVVTGMYEGVTQLFIGVDQQRPFRVFAVDGAVVIDVAS